MSAMSNEQINADLFDEVQRLKKQIAEYKEDMREISEIAGSLYSVRTESDLQVLPTYLWPISNQIGLVHRIALGNSRK